MNRLSIEQAVGCRTRFQGRPDRRNKGGKKNWEPTGPQVKYGGNYGTYRIVRGRRTDDLCSSSGLGCRNSPSVLVEEDHRQEKYRRDHGQAAERLVCLLSLRRPRRPGAGGEKQRPGGRQQNWSQRPNQDPCRPAPRPPPASALIGTKKGWGKRITVPSTLPSCCGRPAVVTSSRPAARNGPAHGRRPGRARGLRHPRGGSRSCGSAR